MIRRPTRSALFPYTPLFRSGLSSIMCERRPNPPLFAFVETVHLKKLSINQIGTAQLPLGFDNRRDQFLFKCVAGRDRKSTRLHSSHQIISDAVFCFSIVVYN